MSDVKIQINSEAALLRLLGGNNELEMQVRDNIANSFIQEHIKPLLNDSKYQAFMQEVDAKVRAIKDDAVKQIVYKVERDGWGGEKLVLNDKIKEELKKAVSDAVVTEIEKSVTATKTELRARVDTLFDRAKVNIARYIEEKLDNQINDALSRRLKVATERLVELSEHYKALTEERKKEERRIELTL